MATQADTHVVQWPSQPVLACILVAKPGGLVQVLWPSAACCFCSLLMQDFYQLWLLEACHDSKNPCFPLRSTSLAAAVFPMFGSLLVTDAAVYSAASRSPFSLRLVADGDEWCARPYGE